MLFAMTVNEKNIELITELNGGVTPGQDCLREDTVFIWGGVGDEPNQLVTAEVFEDNYKVTEDVLVHSVEEI